MGSNAAARVVLITGANRGIGRETARQLVTRGHRVVVTARDENAAERVADVLGADHLRLDVTDPSSIADAVAGFASRYSALDALVNNAGIALDGFDGTVAEATIRVNVRGPMAVTDAFLPVLSAHASIVMVSSGMGELSILAPHLRAVFEDPQLDRHRLLGLLDEFVDAVNVGDYAERGWPGSAYSVSKAGLNALVRIYARELAATGIVVNAICPGWVRTDMGGRRASRSVEAGARGVVWAATLDRGGPNGGFFRDGKPISW